MPSIAQNYEVVLDFTNDTLDSATVQLLRDYGCHSNRIVMLNPGETVSLILDAGDTYKYTLKTKSKVVNVTFVPSPSFLLPLFITWFNFPERVLGETSPVDYRSSSPPLRHHGLQRTSPLGTL